MQLSQGVRRRQKGFTLIEMLIVMGILAIMVSIAIPAMRTAKADAQAAKRSAMVNAIQLAKLRCTLANVTPKISITDSEAAYYSYAQFKKYLRVNGVTSPPIETITRKENNGCGYDIGCWGILNPDTWGDEQYRSISFDTEDFGYNYFIGLGPLLDENQIYPGGEF